MQVNLLGRALLRSAFLLGFAILASLSMANVQVYVGFADTSSAPTFFPNPWVGSPNTTFLGAPGSGNLYHSAAILIYNPGPASVTLSPGASVDGFGAPTLRFQIWDSLIGTSLTIPAGHQVILAQTSLQAGLSNFDPTLDPFSMVPNPPSPVIHLTLNGVATNFVDSAHVMVVGGNNWNANFGRNESLQWRPVGTLDASVAAGTGVNPQGILTWHGDNTRQSANSTETSLSAANLTPTTFGLLFQYPVDGQIFAQPLYVPGVAIPGKGLHNVVYVVTEHNSVYAFDADLPGTGAPLWKFNAGPSVPASDLCAGDQYPEYGITSTPVIDTALNAIYLVANTKTGSASYASTLHALDLSTGAEKLGGPTVIHASVPGKGEGNDGKGNVVFDPLYQNQRASLLLWNNVVYISYGSHCDVPPFHGWIIGYSANNVANQTCVFNSTPDATTTNDIPAGGSFWMSGAGPATDGVAMYSTTANGTFDIDQGGRDYGDSILKMVPSGNTLSVVDYFTPHDQAALNDADLDFGSSGPLLVKPQSGVVFPVLAQTTKTGKIYLVNRTTGSLGKYHTTDQIWKETAQYAVDGGAWSNPAAALGTIYYGGAGGTLRGFSFVNGVFQDTAYSTTAAKFTYPGITPSTSWDGNSAKVTQNVVVWGTENLNGQAVLHAFAGNNLAEIFTGANQNLLDGYVKFTTPTVAAGKVYVAGASKLTVYGGAWFTPAPTISAHPMGAETQISMSTTLPNSVIHYTIDGTNPTASSPTYTAPISLSVSRVVKAQVYANQYRPGAVATQYVVAGTGAISIRCGGTVSGLFLSDAFFTNGTPYAVSTPVSTKGVTNPAPENVYQSERWGDNFSYVFTGLHPGLTYEVRLHFAEIYDLYPGMRVFNVTINGAPALTNFDIIAAAGAPFQAIVKSFAVPLNASTSTLTINLQGVVDNAKISGIEVAPVTTALAAPTKGEQIVMLQDPVVRPGKSVHLKRKTNGLTQAQRAAIQRAYRCRMQNQPVGETLNGVPFKLPFVGL